jgi:Family of unknown function (DUF6364)
MCSTRITLSLDDDALLAAKRYASREKLSLGEAVSRLVRQAARQPPAQPKMQQALHGRFALLPLRDEVITREHMRALMEREGI